MLPARTLRGTKTWEDGRLEDVRGEIFPPSDESGPWAFLVRCPFLFADDKKVAGADAAQAIGLAEAVLRDLLRHHGVSLEGEA